MCALLVRYFFIMNFFRCFFVYLTVFCCCEMVLLTRNNQKLLCITFFNVTTKWIELWAILAYGFCGNVNRNRCGYHATIIQLLFTFITWVLNEKKKFTWWLEYNVENEHFANSVNKQMIENRAKFLNVYQNFEQWLSKDYILSKAKQINDIKWRENDNRLYFSSEMQWCEQEKKVFKGVLQYG